MRAACASRFWDSVERQPVSAGKPYKRNGHCRYSLQSCSAVGVCLGNKSVLVRDSHNSFTPMLCVN
jgi:hypothetical protein